MDLNCPGHHRQREADAAAGGRCAAQCRRRRCWVRQSSAQVAHRHDQGQAGPLPETAGQLPITRARSVIVGPELKLWQCGLPKKTRALQPFIIRKLKEHGLPTPSRAPNAGAATRRWDILEEVIYQHPVLKERAHCTAWASGVRAGAGRGQRHPPAPAGVHGLQRRLRRRPDGHHLPLPSRTGRAHVLMMSVHNTFGPATASR